MFTACEAGEEVCPLSQSLCSPLSLPFLLLHVEPSLLLCSIGRPEGRQFDPCWTHNFSFFVPTSVAALIWQCISPGVYALIGSAALLCGVTRLTGTISLHSLQQWLLPAQAACRFCARDGCVVFARRWLRLRAPERCPACQTLLLVVLPRCIRCCAFGLNVGFLFRAVSLTVIFFELTGGLTYVLPLTVLTACLSLAGGSQCFPVCFAVSLVCRWAA